MKFDKAYLRGAFDEAGLEIPNSRHATKSTVELYILHGYSQLSTDSHLPMILEPLLFTMKERHGEDVSVVGAVTTYGGNTRFKNTNGGRALGVKVATDRPQELLDAAGEMYKRVDLFFVGVTDKNEVVLPTKQPTIPTFVASSPEFSKMLEATSASYPKPTGKPRPVF